MSERAYYLGQIAAGVTPNPDFVPRPPEPLTPREVYVVMVGPGSYPMAVYSRRADAVAKANAHYGGWVEDVPFIDLIDADASPSHNPTLSPGQNSGVDR